MNSANKKLTASCACSVSLFILAVGSDADASGVTDGMGLLHDTSLPTDTEDGDGVTEDPNPPPNYLEICPDDRDCKDLPGDCINCSFTHMCLYGSMINVTCQPKANVKCSVSYRKWAKKLINP